MYVGAVGNSNTLDILQMFYNSLSRNSAADNFQNPRQKTK